ncbi:alpha-soluble NSF attachment protein-like [Sitophilus oryzae]|uniref:Alpha-soluble NSF attachment protein-like n=1 Tax=Sitophilus oryzae TaxID=7048 RepID=A0A6J2YYQ3_SITOR|nr:alpha-soluble NSF attachment protein-like [Sitophilus oryzae]
MASHIENKAIQLRQEAAKKLNPSGFFKTLFGNGNKPEEAIEYYTRAGNLFKMAKNWVQAGIVFVDAAELNCKVEDYLEAAINYSEAGNCFKKCDLSKAIENYMKAIKLYSEMGKFLTAAKLHQSIAEVMEDDRDMTGAIVHYEKAADLFRDENHHSMANRCMQKVAEFSSLEGKYQKAIKIFQDIACFDLSSSLIQYNAREYLFRAAICHLCNDPDIVETIINRYCDMSIQFKDSKECQLILCLLDCIELKDVEGYANTIRMYDAASKLSMWHVTMLLRAKNAIETDCIR